MAARTALARAALDDRIALLAWAAPLLALGLCVAIGFVKHTARADTTSAYTATEASTLAGAGSAIVSHAAFR